MYVFKETGKYYTDEKINIDTSKYGCWELPEKIRNGEIETGYESMYRVFISTYTGNDRDKIPYTVPFMISPRMPLA